MNTIKVPALLLSIAVMAGCSATANQSTSAPRDTAGLDQANNQIASLRSELQRKEAELVAARRSAAMPQSSAAPMDSSLFPPNPKVGECYARVLTPATYKTTREQVVKRDAAERIEIIPAKFETAQERVLVAEASTKLEVIPAVYETVQERVLVRPASEQIVEVPAQYRTETNRILDKPAHSVWKRGPASSQLGKVVAEQVSSDTGEIMCLVEVPATYHSVTREVLVTPATTNVVKVPAEYKTISKRVVKQQATTREVQIPAKYDVVQTTKLVRPAQKKHIDIPAEYATLAKTEKVSDESLQWRSVMCQVNMTPQNVTALQTALNKAGFYEGPVDGVVGPQTLKAASAYASAKSLPAGNNYIAMEVIKSLGINI